MFSGKIFQKEKLDLLMDSGSTARQTIGNIMTEQAKIESMNQEQERALELSRKEIEALEKS